MRNPWTSGSLLFLLFLGLVNMYPLYGSTEFGVITSWSIAFMALGGIAFVATIVLAVTNQPSDKVAAAGVLAFGFWANFNALFSSYTEENVLAYHGTFAILMAIYGVAFVGLQLHKPRE